jgi:DNA repair exonuclease SbcCD ATPase subunit
MKYVEFKELKIQNFLSVGETPVCVEFKKGLHIVTGINRDKEDRRNGVGKSTIADALYFAIFGNTLREINKNFIPNNLTEGKTVVELFFTVNDPYYGVNDFRIVRTLGPSKCTVYKNGVDKTRDTISNTGSYIETVLSSSQEVFQNCVIMTLNNHIPFMAKNKNDKRKFIERIFNLEVFSKMLSELRSDQSEIKRDFDINITRMEETNNYLNSQRVQVDSFENNKNKKKAILSNSLRQHSQDVVDAKEKLDKIEALDDQPFIEKLKMLTLSVEQKTKQQRKLNDDILLLTHTLKSNADIFKRIGTEDDTCPVCLRPIQDHDIEVIEDEKTKLRSSINEGKTNLELLSAEYKLVKSQIVKIEEAINIINAKISDIERQKYSISHLNESIEYIVRCISEIEEEQATIDSEMNTYTGNVIELETKINNITDQISNIKRSLDLLDVVKFVVSEEGVKSFIVKKILRNFNSKLTHYLKEMDSNSICIFNEYFEEEIVNEKGKICQYNNFSGAERKAIDLACLFSFMDMRKAQGDVHYNLSFYDELFDSSLDEKGVDLVLGILNNRVDKNNECVFVISHRKESIKAATGDIIFLEKSNGITKRINFVD